MNGDKMLPNAITKGSPLLLIVKTEAFASGVYINPLHFNWLPQFENLFKKIFAMLCPQNDSLRIKGKSLKVHRIS